MKHIRSPHMCIALACIVVVFLGSLAFVMVHPGGVGLSYVWIPWLTFPLFYMGSHPEKFLLTMLCSFAAGEVWAFLSNLFVGAVLKNAPAPLIIFFTCGFMIALICFVHLGYLEKTPFGCLSAVFVANLLCTYDAYGAGSMLGELLPPLGYIKLFLILAYGCLCTFLLNRLATLLIELICISPPSADNYLSFLHPQGQRYRTQQAGHPSFLPRGKGGYGAGRPRRQRKKRRGYA